MTSKKGRVLNILLAEDNETLGYIVTQQLRDEGHSVQHAINGELALELALLEQFDIILMDITMPCMTGIEVAREIRASRAVNYNTYIIALTGNASQADLEVYASSGINSCLAKPVKKKALIDALASMNKNPVASLSPERMAEYQLLLDEPLIAVAALGEFLTGRPVSRVLKTMEIFRSELRERIQSLQAIVQLSNGKKLKFLAHTLIGSARLLGARRLAEISRLIEEDLNNGHSLESWPATQLLQAAVQTAEVFETINCENSLQRILVRTEIQCAPVKVS